jgi:hypothetical protein
MGMELDNIIGIISKTENLAIIISIISLGVAIFRPMLVSYFENKKIPKLKFEGVWKQNAHVGTDYFIRVTRDEGEGEAEGVKGFVGIKDKFELVSGRWIKRKIETNISIYDYLGLFKIFKQNGKEIITFFNMDGLEPPDANNLYEDYHYNHYKDDKLIVEINAKRGRIKNKQFTKKIEDIVKDAKPIPM